jgi:hypothetical protein
LTLQSINTLALYALSIFNCAQRYAFIPEVVAFAWCAQSQDCRIKRLTRLHDLVTLSHRLFVAGGHGLGS